MRYAVLQLLLLSTLGFADHAPASCQISDKSVLSNSASGIAQVSNLELIQIRCHVAARGPLMKPGEVRNGLKAEAAVYKISADGTRNSVPSDSQICGWWPGTRPVFPAGWTLLFPALSAPPLWSQPP